jgi:uncharacterized protein YlxP (DUF503 family)
MTFGLPANDSLKGKRRIVRRIVDRTRNEFNAAVAEVGHLDEHRRAAIGFAVLSNDARHANSMLDKISRFASGLTEAVVLDRSIEMLHVEPERSMSDMNAFSPEGEDWSDDDSDDDPDREPFES